MKDVVNQLVENDFLRRTKIMIKVKMTLQGSNQIIKTASIHISAVSERLRTSDPSGLTSLLLCWSCQGLLTLPSGVLGPSYGGTSPIRTGHRSKNSYRTGDTFRCEEFRRNTPDTDVCESTTTRTSRDACQNQPAAMKVLDTSRRSDGCSCLFIETTRETPAPLHTK